MHNKTLTTLLYILGAIFAFIIVCKIVSSLIGIAIFAAVVCIVGYILLNLFK